MTLSLFAVLFGGTAISNAQLPPVIDRELIFGNPEYAGAQISPDGKYISFIKPLNGTMNIWVKGFAEPFSAARPMTADTARPVRNYFWSRDAKYILFVQDKGGDENFNVYAVNPADKPAAGSDVPAARNITDAKGVRAIIQAVPKSDPDAIYVGINDRASGQRAPRPRVQLGKGGQFALGPLPIGNGVERIKLTGDGILLFDVLGLGQLG